MGSTPYENEPGFEKSSSRQQVKIDGDPARKYSQKITHETIRITVCNRLEALLGMNTSPSVRKTSARERKLKNALPSPSEKPLPYNDIQPMNDIASKNDVTNREAQISTTRLDLHLPTSSKALGRFNDLSKQLFLAYYSRYITIVKRESATIKKGAAFYHAPFESENNEMSGVYDYPVLEKRLIAIRETLENESKQWTIQGKEQIVQQTTIASRLKVMFLQTSAEFKNVKNLSISLEDAEANPFLWVVTYIGQPGSLYEGGIWNIDLRFSPNYPEEQARVKFRTPIYHVNVAPDGIIWQARLLQGDENIKYLIQSIIDIFEGQIQTDPAMCLNLEAAKLAFGTDAQKRDYNRSIRRMVSRTAEY